MTGPDTDARQPTAVPLASGPRRRRWPRVLLWLVVLVVLLAAGGFVAGGWYYSDQLLPAPVPGAPTFDLDVLAVTDDQVTLEDDGDAATPGTFGLDYADGFAQITDIVADGDGTVTRRFAVLEGEPPEPGDVASTTAYAFPEDAAAAEDAIGVDGVEVEEVALEGPLGAYPAWAAEVDGATTWAVVVHGRGATRAEAVRLLPTLVDLGLTTLVISYRNDGVAPATEDGFGRFGWTEWRDLEAAAQHALSDGARRLVLVGYSQGGGVVAQFLRRSGLADTVSAAVLDAPFLSMDATLELSAAERGIPDPLVEPLLAVTKAISDLRADLPFDELEHVAAADTFAVPMLIFHGDADRTVPVEPSRAFAAARPDLVDYVEVEDTDHVRAWNVDPARYESLVRDFLADHVDGA